MALYSFSEKKKKKLSRSKVTNVESCLIYYLFNGRNAWHSTWTTRYMDGCMDTSIEGAKNSAERQRTQGSVFYIVELPCLVFRSVIGAIAVSQINTGNPLAGYSADAVEEHIAANTKRIRGARNCYISKGAPMLGAALSFNHESRFWVQRPPRKDAIILVGSNDPKLVFSPLTSSKLRSWRSWSNGGSYRLGWTEVKDRYDNTSTKPIRDLAARFETNLDGPRNRLPQQ